MFVGVEESGSGGMSGRGCVAGGGAARADGGGEG